MLLKTERERDRKRESERDTGLSVGSRQSAWINEHARSTAINAFDKELKKSYCTWNQRTATRPNYGLTGVRP